MKSARRLGRQTLGGLDMFVAQGARQFRMFTGREAPVEILRRAVESALAREVGDGNL